MNKSESIGELAKALVKVQAVLQPATKDAKNPFFKSNYATLNAVWDVCREPLTANGLAVAQLNRICDGGVIIETVLMHTSGEWISGEIFLPLAKIDAQGVGSASSYGRRYGLAAAVGIVADVDDDGNAASKPPTNQPPAQAKPSAKDGLIEGIKTVCKALNASFDSINWSLQTTNEYISAQFGDGVTLQNASEEQLNDIAIDLQNRLAELRKEKK